ncbi:MAG: geranylgeranylglycerol-phosphate geranylgeranyltransferase [Methanolinea sp.]|nr:geranylgeranylglycerol-phosphate geranylgeranyltransferase [Methanolinea sp.]
MLPGYVRLVRPLNAVVAGIAGIIGYIIATGSLEPTNIWIFLVVFLVTAGGNAINDYCDVEIDRINRPDRPIPSGEVNRASVPVYSAALFLSGIAASFAMNYLCVAIAALNSALLVWYAVSLKRTAGAGNAAISYLTASIFVFGAASAGAGAVVRVIPLAVVTFLAMLARELWKDAEDLEGDAAAGASTLPVRMGIKPVVRLGFAFLAGAIAASLLPALWWGLPYLAGIAAVDTAILWAALRALPCGTPGCIRQSNATALVKYAMFASLAVFTASALFL